VTALSPVIGYDKASKIAHFAMDNDLTVKAAALQLGFVTRPSSGNPSGFRQSGADCQPIVTGRLWSRITLLRKHNWAAAEMTLEERSDLILAFTGVARAPLTGMVLVTEMTSSVTMLLPMLGACFAAMLIPRVLFDPCIYNSLRENTLQREPALPGKMKRADSDLADRTSVSRTRSNENESN
jgi:hypothetical protein